jgi:hypothetical protein
VNDNGEGSGTQSDAIVNGTEKNEYVAVKLSYTNNVNVEEGKKAEVIATIVDSSKTYDLGDTTVTTISGSQKIGEFTVEAFDLTGSSVKLDQVSYTWDGKGITLNQDDFKLYVETTVDGKKVKNYIDSSLYKVTKVDGKDVDAKTNAVTIAPQTTAYSVTIASADATNANVTVSEASGVITNAVKVNKANWSDAVITFGDQTSDSTPNVTVTLNGNKLSSTHYTATSEKYADGVAKVTVTPDTTTYFANGSQAVIDYVNIGTDISKYIKSVALTDATTKSYTYTGEAIEPEVTVTPVTGITLTEGVDYEIVYTSNVDKGDATITVKGLGSYAGEVTLENAFKITQAKITDTTITADDVTYEKTLPTVADLAKSLTIKNGNTTLVYGEDFTVVGGTVKDGANTLRISAIAGGNYTGITTVTVNVKKVVDLSDATVTAKRVGYNADAKVTVVLDGTTLTEGTDYTVEADTTTPGLATATVTGTGDYTGTATATFIVNPNKGSSLKVSKTTTSSVTLKWAKKKGADGYVIYEGSKKIATVVGKTNTSYTISGLKAGSKHTYKVRAYVSVDGKNYGGAFSDTVTATVKK